MALSYSDLQRDIATIKTLLNAQLKTILRHERLGVTGVKNVLQQRIITLLEQLYAAGDAERIARVRGHIQEVRGGQATAQSQSPSYPRAPGSAAYAQPTFAPISTASRLPPFSHGRLSFKDSPFFTVLEPLTPVAECKVRESTRDSVELKVILSATNAARLQEDPSLRVLVYCAVDTGLTQFTKSDVTFPAQVELKVNFDSVPAKLRGLKNKPGTTNPADITSFLRKKPGYPNKVDLVYALTNKRYFLVINLVQKHPVDELISTLRSRKLISAEQVLREMKSRIDDADIVATASVMSLKCPISACRIANPCRSTVCTHNQCFDAASFLLLQEQAPTWTCPVCNKTTSFEALQVDQYVDNILKTTHSEVDQVVVEPNGEWYVQGEGGPDRQASTPAMGEDDDIVEITEDRPMQAKEEEQPSGTPANLSRIPQQSSTPIATPSGSTAKRKQHEVIDLTLSDEDEEPPRPPKRVFHRLTLHSPAYQSPYRPNDLQSRFDPDNPTNGYSAQYEPTGHSLGANGQNPGQFT